MRTTIVILLLLAGCARTPSDSAQCLVPGYGAGAAGASYCRQEMFATRQREVTEFRTIPIGFRP